MTINGTLSSAPTVVCKSKRKPKAVRPLTDCFTVRSSTIISTSYQIRIFTRWATDGIVCFCITVVGLSRAPVGTKRMLRCSPRAISPRILPHSTDAQHPQPDPPACTSWLSSNIITPQSLCRSSISMPLSASRSRSKREPIRPRSPVKMRS